MYIAATAIKNVNTRIQNNINNKSIMVIIGKYNVIYVVINNIIFYLKIVKKCISVVYI
jgi:hypothetical protein